MIVRSESAAVSRLPLAEASEALLRMLTLLWMVSRWVRAMVAPAGTTSCRGVAGFAEATAAESAAPVSTLVSPGMSGGVGGLGGGAGGEGGCGGSRGGNGRGGERGGDGSDDRDDEQRVALVLFVQLVVFPPTSRRDARTSGSRSISESSQPPPTLPSAEIRSIVDA